LKHFFRKVDGATPISVSGIKVEPFYVRPSHSIPPAQRRNCPRVREARAICFSSA